MEIETAIEKLHAFWRSEGCDALPPWGGEVASPRLHPLVSPHLLAPAAWSAAGVQAVYRPLEGRYGQHPYRLARQLRWYALFKPPANDVPALFRRYLAALELDLAERDLRFVEWQLEEPLTGTSGRGWRAILDGLEIARISYLETFGGVELESPAVELEGGLERLLALLAKAPSVFELSWTEGGASMSERRRSQEAEHSRYIWELADAELLRNRLDGLVGESRRCLEVDLPHAAWELAIRGLCLAQELQARLWIGGAPPELGELRDTVAAIARRLAATSGEEVIDGGA